MTRHPGVVGLLRWFEYEHLPKHLQYVSEPFSGLAQKLLALPDSAELTAALRKLLEAKDCAVRAAVEAANP